MRSVAGAALALLLLPVQARTAQPVTTISGDYVEVRSNYVYTCGCQYSGESVTGGREGTVVWRIKDGEYLGTSLGGIKVASLVLSESNLGKEGAVRRSVLYLDGVHSAAQQEAIVRLWERAYAGILGHVEAIRNATITIQPVGNELNVDIGGVLRLRMRKAQLPADAHPGSSLWYGPFAPLEHATLATTLYYEYSGTDFNRQWRDMTEGVRGYLGEFALTSRSGD